MESRRGPSPYQPNALPLGQTGSQFLTETYLSVECYFTPTETVGLLGTGAQDGHLDFHTALSSEDTYRMIMDVKQTLMLMR